MRWIGFLVALLPNPVEACSHPLEPGAPYLTFPLDAATGVPTNVVVGVSQVEWQPIAPAFWHLKDPSGALVDVAVSDPVVWGSGDMPTTSTRLTPTTPLAPLTRYEVVQVDGDVVVIAGEFTTGSSEDTNSPAAPVLTTPVDAGSAQACESRFTCCNPDTQDIGVSLDVAAPTEPVVYTIREGTEIIAEDTTAPLEGLLCNGTPSFHDRATLQAPPEWMASGGSHTLDLTARDLAGNESPSLTITINADCTLSDQGTGSLPHKSGGCAVGGSGSAGGVWIFALLLWMRKRP